MTFLRRLALFSAACTLLVALLVALRGGEAAGRPRPSAPDPGATPTAGHPAPPDTSFEAFWETVRAALRADDPAALATLIADEFLVEDVLSITSADAFIDLYPELFPPEVRDVFLHRMPEPSDLVEGSGRVLLWDDGEAQRLFLVLQRDDGAYRLAGFYPYYEGE